MRLSAMADAFKHQLSDEKYQELSFEERVGIIVDVEWAKRRSNKLLRLIKRAGFRYPQASIEDIEYHADRKLDKAQILRLSGCAYIQEKRNIIIMGASGNGNYVKKVVMQSHEPESNARRSLTDSMTLHNETGSFTQVIEPGHQVFVVIPFRIPSMIV
ncbi:MAG: ATP-binding protein, partial [Eubacteriales bacterium]|nr:ATP-binding protein [Eubacteriales bacterium]